MVDYRQHYKFKFTQLGLKLIVLNECQRVLEIWHKQTKCVALWVKIVGEMIYKYI